MPFQLSDIRLTDKKSLSGRCEHGLAGGGLKQRCHSGEDAGIELGGQASGMYLPRCTASAFPFACAMTVSVGGALTSLAALCSAARSAYRTRLLQQHSRFLSASKGGYSAAQTAFHYRRG